MKGGGGRDTKSSSGKVLDDPRKKDFRSSENRKNEGKGDYSLDVHHSIKPLVKGKSAFTSRKKEKKSNKKN